MVLGDPKCEVRKCRHRSGTVWLGICVEKMPIEKWYGCARMYGEEVPIQWYHWLRHLCTRPGWLGGAVNADFVIVVGVMVVKMVSID